MALARQDQAAVRLADGRVLIIGGTVPFTGKCGMACVGPATASVEVDDPSTGKFSHNGSLAQARSDATALLLNDGRVLVAGGPFGVPTETMEIYNPATGKSALVKLPASLASLPDDAAIALLADGRVLIAGGSYDRDESTSNATLIFDPASGAFSDGPLMAKPRAGATATLLEDGRVLIVGGDDYEGGYGYGVPAVGVELIDPSKPLSQSTLLVPQDYPGASTFTLLSDGRVLVTNWGWYLSGPGACGVPEVSEMFDPRTEVFTPLAPMTTPRTGSTAIRIPDGRVLFLGGVDASCVALGTVEAFDPDSETFQVIATGFPKIDFFTAALLGDGRILVAGGSNDTSGQMTAASWLLEP